MKRLQIVLSIILLATLLASVPAEVARAQDPPPDVGGPDPPAPTRAPDDGTDGGGDGDDGGIIKKVFELVFPVETMQEATEKLLFNILQKNTEGMQHLFSGMVASLTLQNPGVKTPTGNPAWLGGEDIFADTWRFTVKIAVALWPATLAIMAAVGAEDATLSGDWGGVALKQALAEWVRGILICAFSLEVLDLANRLSNALILGIIEVPIAGVMDPSMETLVNILLGGALKVISAGGIAPLVAIIAMAVMLVLGVATVIALIGQYVARIALLYIIVALAPIVLVISILRPARWLRWMWIKGVILVMLLGPITTLLLKLAVAANVGVPHPVLGFLMTVGVISVLLYICGAIIKGIFGAAGQALGKATETAKGIVKGIGTAGLAIGAAAVSGGASLGVLPAGLAGGGGGAEGGALGASAASGGAEGGALGASAASGGAEGGALGASAASGGGPQDLPGPAGAPGEDGAGGRNASSESGVASSSPDIDGSSPRSGASTTGGGGSPSGTGDGPGSPARSGGAGHLPPNQTPSRTSGGAGRGEGGTQAASEGDTDVEGKDGRRAPEGDEAQSSDDGLASRARRYAGKLKKKWGEADQTERTGAIGAAMQGAGRVMGPGSLPGRAMEGMGRGLETGARRRQEEGMRGSSQAPSSTSSMSMLSSQEVEGYNEAMGDIHRDLGEPARSAGLDLDQVEQDALGPVWEAAQHDTLGNIADRAGFGDRGSTRDAVSDFVSHRMEGQLMAQGFLSERITRPGQPSVTPHADHPSLLDYDRGQQMTWATGGGDMTSYGGLHHAIRHHASTPQAGEDAAYSFYREARESGSVGGAIEAARQYGEGAGVPEERMDPWIQQLQ